MLCVNSSNVVSKSVLDESHLDEIKRTGLLSDRITNVRDLDKFVDLLEREGNITIQSKLSISTSFTYRDKSENKSDYKTKAAIEILSQVRRNVAYRGLMKSMARNIKALGLEFAVREIINSKDKNHINQSDEPSNEPSNDSLEVTLDLLVSEQNIHQGSVFIYAVFRVPGNEVKFQLVGLEIYTTEVKERKYEVTILPRIYNFRIKT